MVRPERWAFGLSSLRSSVDQNNLRAVSLAASALRWTTTSAARHLPDGIQLTDISFILRDRARRPLAAARVAPQEKQPAGGKLRFLRRLEPAVHRLAMDLDAD